MPLEVLNTIGSVGTFLVIAATAEHTRRVSDATYG